MDNRDSRGLVGSRGGSNFPSSRVGGYLGQVQLGQTALPWLSDDDRHWIIGATAHTLWPMLHGPARG